MRFSVYRYPKLQYGALLGLFGFLTFFFLGFASYCFFANIFDFSVFLLCIFFGLFFGVLGCFLTVRRKADYLAEFSFDPKGITIYHQKNGEYTILWSEIADSGILDIHRSSHYYHQKFVYFSKNVLTKKDIVHLDCCVKSDCLCAQYDDEILWAVQEYFPISLEVKRIYLPKNISKKDLE